MQRKRIKCTKCNRSIVKYVYKVTGECRDCHNGLEPINWVQLTDGTK